MTATTAGDFIDDDILDGPSAQIALIQELMERSLELARIGGFQLDLQTRIVTLLPQTSRILGVNCTESVTQEAFLALFAADRRLLLQDALTNAATTGNGFELDLPLDTAAGSVIWIRATAEVVWFGARPARVVGALQDVTRSVTMQETLRHSTERHELAADVGDIGIWERDLVTGERHWNDVLFRIYGRPPVEGDALRSMWLDNLHPDDRTRAERALARAVSGEEEFNIEYRIRRPTGEVRFTKTVARVQRNAAGAPLRMIGVKIDITDRVEAMEREAARAQAEQANSAKSQFLATMSHEIRTPINGIIGMIELVGHSVLTDDQRKMVSTVESSSRALLRIVNDILDLSKIEAGKLEIDIAPMSVRRVVEETTEILRINVARLSTRVDCFVDPQIPVALLGDAGRIGQILTNLVNNAAKFSSTNRGVLPQISVRAELDATRSTDAAVGVRFSVQDNGIGMTQSVVNKLFQPFTQAEQSTSRVYGGTGLGLSICARLAQLMGGTIGVASEPGVGSVFTVHVPFSLASDQDAASIAAAGGQRAAGVAAIDTALPASIEAAEACGRLLLVAEDNEVNQDLIQRQLNSLGYRADIAGNGREALAMVDGRRYAALLTDCHMPEMDGYELCEAVRQREITTGRHLPIVALSADVMASHYQRCADVGMDDHWSKPLVMGSLREGLVRLLGTAATPVASPAPTVQAVAAAALDLTRLKEMVGDDADAQSAILRKYVTTSGKCVGEIVAALARQAAAEMGALGHKLKSSSRAIGADAVADLCANLERAGKEGRLADCAPLVGALETQFAMVVAAIGKVT